MYYRSVPQIHPPPAFCNLALVQSAGEAYTRDATFSLVITPSLNREMFSSSVDTGFILALPFHHEDLEPDCVRDSTRGGAERRTRGGEMLPMLAVGWCVHHWCGRYALAVDTFTVDSRVA